MNSWYVFLSINLVWFLSEIVIGRLTFHQSDQQQTDRKSLPGLWLTILPTVFLGVYVSLHGLGRMPFSGKWMLNLGTMFIIFGLILRWWAVLTLRHFFTSNVQILENHRLIDQGPYSAIRHPAYAGSLISFLGLGLGLNSWLSILIILIPIFLAFSFRIKVEEQALVTAFGEAYKNYQQRTKKLIPFLY